MTVKRLLAVLAMALAGGCVGGRAPAPDSGSPASRLPVLLVVEGTAFDPEATADVAAALSKQIGRPVVVARESALDEAGERARLQATYGALPARGWAEPRCTLGRAAAHAVRYGADAYYRAHVDRTDVASDATADERAAVPGARRATAAALRGLRLAPAGSAQTVELSGALTAATFGQTPETHSVPVHATVRAVDALGTVHVDVAGAVAEAAARLASPPYPHWNVLARSQLAAGCRITALAVYDTRLRERADSRGILDSALGRKPKRPARAPAPAVVAAVPPPADTSGGPADAHASCRALCEIHMVELCNNDRDLWSRNQQLWQSTPCGQRRSEEFLRDCYQRQWLSGTFDEACMTPCERSGDGRARLLHMLQSGGCTRVSSL